MEGLEFAGQRGFFRPVGEGSFDKTKELVAAAITTARANNLRELLVNVSALTGFPVPSVTQRFYMVTQWAEAARGQVRVAVVARAEMIDRDKFGVTVAANRGMVSEVFLSEAEALAWFDAMSDSER